MKKAVPLTVFLVLLGIALAPANSLAAGDNEQYRATEHFHTKEQIQATEHDHHHHAMAAHGYTRSVASYRTPEVKLVDAEGKEVALANYLDGEEPVMLNFIFTTCTTICPAMSATFAQLQAMLGQESKTVRMVSISIDPEHDTPGQLNEYAKRFEAGTQWHLLTGSVEDSVAVQRAFGVFHGDKMNHQPVTFMRKGTGQPWTRIDGFASADELLREYRQLMPDR